MSSRFVHIHVNDHPEWRRVEGRTRCQDCGEIVAVSWKLFVTPSQSTQCLCETCVEEKTA